MKTSPDDSAAADGRPAPRPFFHEGMRAWQDRFDSRRLADRLEERLGRNRFTADDRAFIESRTMFFLATADEAGRPDCSYKGGDAGFVRVTGDDELVFPSYDGNGMFRSIGNLSTHAPVGLLFIDFEQPRRLRVNGLASVQPDDPLRDEFTGAQLIVRVRATHIFPNCPRYIHRMQLAEPSPYVPRPGVEPPVPAWKQFEMFSDVLPRERGGGSGCEGGNSAGGGGGEPGCARHDDASRGSSSA
jgi:predicted pyridoxine 5'-phosphate oxidase superfamily flavin-nucleotide-binding protein